MGEAERDTAGRGVLPDVPEVPDREKLAEAFGTTGEMSADAQMSEWLSQRARAGALNALDGEFHRFTSSRADMEDSDRAFKFLDEFSERRFGVRGERGLAWTENGGKDGGAREFGSPEEYAGFLRKILVRGYTAIESDAEREWRKAKDSGDRAAMIRAAGIETMKMTHRDDGTYAFFDPGMGFDNATIAKSDDEIDDELRDYDARMAARRFGVLAKAMGKDFAPEEMDIAYAALRHGDGLPPERAADYYAVLKSDPDKARRLSFLIEASRRQEPALARDVAGALGRTFRSTFGNFGLGEGPAIGLQGWLEQSFTDAFLGGEAEKRIRDARIDSRGYNMLWNDEEKAEYDRLMAERGPDPEFGDALVRNGIDYKAHRRMVREALPLAERARIRKEELAMDELVSHRQYEGYGYVARTAIGIASTLPYMAFTAVPVAGFAGNVASQFQEISDDVLMRGGDPDEAEGWKWASAILWAGIEKAQLGGVVGKPMTALQKRMRFIREIDAIEGSAAARKGLRKLAAAIRAGAAETGATMVAESAEEGGQGFVEAFTREMLLSHDPSTALDKAGAQGLNDFVESLGTMAVIGGFGAAKKMATVRTAQLDAESLGDYAARRLQVMNTLRGQTSSPGADAEAPGRVRRALDDMKDIWKASSDHVAALDQIREKYGFTDEQLRNVADYLDMQDAILAIARNQDDAGTAYAYASFAGGAFPIGRPGAHFDPQSLYDLILPGAKVEDVEVPDLDAEPTVEYTPEQIAAAEEARAAQAAVNDAKVGSARRGAERRLRRAKERLARANANAPAPVHPLRKAQKITLPDGSSYVIERDTSAPNVHTASFAASVEQAMSGAEGLKGGASVSLDEFKAMSVDEKMGVAVTAEQYMAMSEAERESYLAQYDLAEGGSMRILDAEGKELLGADAVVKIKRGYAKFVRTGGNWELAHEHGHFISAVARKTMTDAQKETMRRLFGAARPGVDEEWNEEVANDGLAEWLRGKYDFRRSTRAERRAKMNWFQRLLDTVKGFFALTGEEAPEAPVERTMREQAEDAVFEALKNGDFSSLDRFAGIEFGEDVGESARKDEELVQRESPENKGRNASVDESGEQSPKLVHETATAPTVSKAAPSVPNTAQGVPKADTGATAAENAALRAKIAELQAQLASRPGAVAASQPVRTGSKMTVFTPGYEMSVEAEPMWVPLASLVESTGDREVQMRDRSRMATDQQVLSKTRKGVFQPLALFPKSKSDDGAPIVGGGLNIISGHGRKRMLEQLVKEGRFGEYLDAVNSEAERQGLPSAPEGMENPVLVLRVTGGLETRENLTRFAELSNRWGGLERSGAEHAESDARKITPALLRLYSPDASGNLLAASNRPFMAAFLKEVGATGLTNKDGTPTAEAALRVQRAMMAAVFGSDDKVRDMVQNLMERSGELSLATLQNALMRSAGKLLAMKRQKGSFDIVDDVREAAYQYIAWRVAQQKNPRLSLADHLNQSDFFTSAVPALQQALARLLEVERFGGALDRYAELVAQEAVDEQSTFGFFEKHTPLQLLGMAERALLAEGETPVTPDPASAEAAAPVQTPPAVQEEDAAPAPSGDPVAVAQQVLAPQPAAFTPVQVKRGAATLPGPGAAQFPASQVNADGQPTTKVRMLPAGAWNLLRPAYDTGKPPAPSEQDRAGRGLGISRPAPTGHADIFPHFQGNKTEMAARTSQAIRNTMSDAERAHYTTIVDYFGGGGCWGLYHALENFPNVRQLVVNEFDPDRVGKIRLLHEIDGQVADEAAALLEPYIERLRTATQDSSSPVTIANKAEALVKREIEDEHQRAVLQAFIDCAKTMLATSKDADGNPINDIRLGVERALAALREDGRKAKAAADEFKARGGRISYRSGDAAAFDDAPSGHQVMAVADPPYYLTADYQQNTILGLDEVPDNWSYRATQNLLHKLVAKGDGILYTDEAWWFKEGYVPDQQEDLFGGGSTFQKEQEVLLDIINTLDHFDVAGRVVGRQEVLGVHHGHTTDEESENGADGNAAGSASADNGGREQGAGQPVLGVAEVAEGQGGNDGTARKERGRDGAGAAAGRAGAASGNSATGSGTDGASPGLGARAIAREVVVQDVAASIEDASLDSDPGAVDALVRHSVRQVREARMADYARTVSRNAKRWLKDAAMRLDERMAAAGFTEKVWHGTYGEDFNVFRFTSGNHEVPAAYFTYDRGTAQNYAALTGMDYADDDADENLYNTRQFYVNPGKCYEHDERKTPTTLAEFKQLLADLYAQGYDSVIVRHALDDQGARLDEFDNGPMSFIEPDERPGDGEGDFETDILIVMQQPGGNAATRIKAADPVTFLDDVEEGMPIPLEFRADQTMPDVRFSVAMGKNAREEAERAIRKYRPDIHGILVNVNGVLTPMDTAAINSIAEFETPKERKAALFWFCKDTIRLPEDALKVTEAIKTAEKAKIDPFQYECPGEILTKFADYRPKEKPINPDTVPELSDKRELGNGIVTYLVQDDKAGQAAMRRIINTHFGKDASPWCLLQGDGKGNLTNDAWSYWQHYSALPKRVAFRNGKLTAFMATQGSVMGGREEAEIRYEEAIEDGEEIPDREAWIREQLFDADAEEEWWDRNDASHAGIPFERSVPDDLSSGKTTETVELMSDGKERVIERKRTRTAADGTKMEEFWDGTGNRALKYKRTITYPGGSHEVTEKYEAVERTAFYDAEGHFVAQTERKLDGSLVSVFDEMGNTKASVSSMDGVGNVWQYGIGNMGISPETADAYVSAVEDAVRRGDPIPPPPTATRHSVQARPMTAVEIARAVEYFGTTEDPKETAFILYDGRWLDYEQMGEHWEISQAFNKGHMKQLDALQEFEGDAAPYVDAALNAGLVRVTGGVFDLRGNPTEAGIQLAVAPDAVMARNIVDYVESLADRYPTVRTLTVESYAAGAEFTRQYDMGDPRALAQIRRDINESLVRHSVASRRLDWDALPNLHGQTEDVPTIDQLLYDRNGAVNSRAWFDAHPGRQAKHGGWMDESQSADSVRSSVTRGRSARLDDLAVAYVAQRHLAGKEAKVEDVDKLLKNLGLGALNASELSARAKALADTNREVARSLVERNSTELVAHLRAASMSDRLTSALDAAITGGAKAADPETGRLLAEAVQSRQTIDLMCAKGFTAAQMMAELPIDLAKAVLAVGEYERTPEEAARLEEARREREKEREEEKAEAEAAGMTVKELRAKKAAEAEDDSSYREPSAEQKAALDELMDRARFAEEARRDEAERKRRLAEKRREEREGANADDDGGVEGGTGDINDLPDVPLDTVKRIAPVFESPGLFAQFVIEWTGDHIVARHPELPNTAEMWKSPVAIRELKQTATHILRDLAINALGAPTGNHARNFADHIINELESDAECRTYNAVRRKISYIYGTIHDDALRISRRKLVENLIVNIRREAGAKGRFSAITEDMQRVVDGKTELWGRRLVRYLTMSEENLSEEISRLRSIVENDPTRDDAGNTQLGYVEEAADKLAIALKYGGMIRWMPGKISEAADEIMGLLKGRRQAFEQRREQRKARNEAIRKALIDAIENGAGGVFREKDGGVSRYLQSMQGNLTLEMQNLIRFCKDPALRQAALEAIEALQIEISEASARYRVVLGEAQRQLREGLSAVYGDADAGMRHLLGDEIPEEAAQVIFKTREMRPTYGQLLQLYATTIQSDYRENAETHGRTEQLPMMEATLTDQDKRFHAWAVEWYRQARQSLSDAVEAVTGLPVKSPDARYTPARMDNDPDGFSVDAVAWSPVPSALNRRIKHGRDFDESVNFLSMLQEQAEIRAQTIGYSETGILMRDTIASRDVQAAARKNVGKADMKRVTDHVRDVLVQGAARKGESAFFAPVNAARAWMARFYLSGNIPSALKQLASMPVWANALLGGREIGFSGVLRYLTTVGTEEGREAVRELMESDGYRARYVMGWSEETQNVLQNPSRTKFVRAIAKVLDKGMIVNKFVDGVSCLWMAQGFYRDATANFLAKGFDEAEAKRRAMALTWSCLESGQQSGRVENMNAIQRDKGATGAAAAAIFQFKTAFLLQNNYLFQALREWRAGTPGAKGRFLRAATINGLYIPAFCMAVNALWKAILGDEPPEEDPEKMPSWFKEMAWSMVNGVTAPMFGVSMAAHSLYDAVTGSHNYASDAGLPAVEGMVRTVRHGATVFYDLGHGMLERVNAFDLEDEVTSEKIKGDVDRLLRDLAAPYRHGSKLYQNRVGDE